MTATLCEHFISFFNTEFKANASTYMSTSHRDSGNLTSVSPLTQEGKYKCLRKYRVGGHLQSRPNLFLQHHSPMPALLQRSDIVTS